MGRANKFGIIEISMKVIGKRINQMGMEDIFLLVVIIMKENGRKGKLMERESIFGRMGKHMKDIMLLIKCKAKVFIPILTVQNMKEIMSME